MTDKPIVRKRKLSDYRPDPRNANQGTERGQYMLDKSVEQVGAARSIVAAADDTIPAGNKSLQAFVDAGFEDVIEVETDGNTPVVVKRTDWASVDSEKARQYAYYDNRASEVGLAWDTEQLLEDLKTGVDLEKVFFDWELDILLDKAAENDLDYSQEWQGMPEFEQEDQTAFHVIKVHFASLEDLRAFAELIDQPINEKTTYIYYPKQRKEALIKCAVIDES